MPNALLWTIQLIFVPVISPFFIGVIRKIKAWFQNRAGADIWQPYRDLRKLFRKGEVVSEDASWIFRFAPYIIFAVTLSLGASIPILTVLRPVGFLGDFISLVYLVALGTFFLALAGIDAGSAFGGFGSSREMTMAALTEGGLFFSILSVAFLAHTTNVFGISAAIASLPLADFLPVLLAFAAFIVAMLAETARFPFDNPATHLELTMIHEAMILEYSGPRLALLEWAAANKLLIFMTLGINLFLPWGIAVEVGWSAVASAFLWYMLKVLGLSFFIDVLESTIAKYRFFRLPDLLLTSFILTLIAVSLIL